MNQLFHTVQDIHHEADTLRDRRYGVIEFSRGCFVGVHLRPWPKIISASETSWLGGGFHQRAAGDRCWLYYNQPRGCPEYLTLKYIVSSCDCTFMTCRRSLTALDWIAKIKRSDAIVCEAFNARLSNRLLRRFGWARHLHNSRRRHYIKRFYGDYPMLPDIRTWSCVPEDAELLNA